MMASSWCRARGFTYIELAVSLGLVGMIAMVSLPLYEVTSTRLKEAQLRHALQTIRSGIDAYKAAVETGTLLKKADESGYPPSLEVLTEPLDVVNKSNASPLSTDSGPQRVVILRQLPRDPFALDSAVSAAQTWVVRSYGSRSDDPQPGADVYDVSSASPRIGLDGRPYSAW